MQCTCKEFQLGGLCPHALAVRHAMFARPGEVHDEDRQIPPEYRDKRVRNTPKDIRVLKAPKRGRDADTEENEDDEEDPTDLGRPLHMKGGKYGVEKPKAKGNRTQRGRTAKATTAQKGRLLRLRRNSEREPSPDDEEAEEEDDQEDEDEDQKEEDEVREGKAPPKKKQKIGPPAARMSWDTLLETQVYHTRVACPGCDLAIAVRLRSDYREAKESKSYIGQPEKSWWQCCNCDNVVDHRSSSRDRTRLFKTKFTWAQYMAHISEKCEPGCVERMEQMVDQQIAVFKASTARQRLHDQKKVRVLWTYESPFYSMLLQQKRCDSSKTTKQIGD